MLENFLLKAFSFLNLKLYAIIEVSVGRIVGEMVALKKPKIAVKHLISGHKPDLKFIDQLRSELAGNQWKFETDEDNNSCYAFA
jgi:hypothetical protein